MFGDGNNNQQNDNSSLHLYRYEAEELSAEDLLREQLVEENFEVTIYYHSKQSLFYQRICLAIRLSGLSSAMPVREHKLPNASARECCLLAGGMAHSATQFYRLLEMAIASYQQLCRETYSSNRKCRSLLPSDIAEEVSELHAVLARLEARTPAREAARSLAAAEARLLLTDQDRIGRGGGGSFLFGSRPTIADVDLLTYLNAASSDWLAEGPKANRLHPARRLPGRLQRYLAANSRLAPPKPSLTDWLLPDARTIVTYTSAAAFGLSLAYFIIRHV